jgi:dienelactone hydrolase
MNRIAAFAALALLTAASPAQQAAGQHRPFAVNDDTVSVVRGSQAGTLMLPSGPPPFAAVILLHGCSGVTQNMQLWAQRLVSWGYAALILDSFGSRGIDTVCNRGNQFPGRERAKDSFAAAAYLRQRAEIDPTRIGLIGFSHGGSTALAASVQNWVAAYNAKPFQAVIAYYPYCPSIALQLASDVQILIGSADDWTPAQRCADLAALYTGSTRHKPLLKIYPGAVHVFDGPGATRLYFGHRLAYDAAAATDSFKVTKQFLDRHLRPETPHE